MRQGREPFGSGALVFLQEAEPVHALLSELRTLPAEIKQKMWLYHYADCWNDEAYGFVPDEFAGFAQPATRYTLFAKA